MAPREGEFHQEKSLRFLKQSALLQQKAKFAQVVAAMKTDPNYVFSCHDHLSMLGAFGGSGASGDTTANPKGKGKLALQDGLVPMASLDANAGHVSSGSCGASDPLQPPQKGAAEEIDECGEQVDEPNTPGGWDKNTCKWEQMPVEKMELALRAAEPAVFTVANMKVLIRRGARSANQLTLVKYLEFMTGSSPSGSIPEAVKDGQLESVVKQLNEQAGRRAKELVLPADWATSGIYAVRLEGTQLIASHRFLDKEVVVAGKYNSAQSFFVDANWSETKAEIHEKGGFFQQPLYILFFRNELAEKDVPVVITGAAAKGRRHAKTSGANMTIGKPGPDDGPTQKVRRTDVQLNFRIAKPGKK